MTAKAMQKCTGTQKISESQLCVNSFHYLFKGILDGQEM